MKFRSLVIICGSLAIGACATKPENIAPTYVSETIYHGWSCKQLGAEQHRLAAALATKSKQQKKARRNDTIGVVAIGLPVSWIGGGNVATQVARLKGEQEAAQRAAAKSNC